MSLAGGLCAQTKQGTGGEHETESVIVKPDDFNRLNR
jgi:hypothetical protein